MIEADVETRVRLNGAFENRPGTGLACAGFLHTTARPVDGTAADPHPALAHVLLQRHATTRRGSRIKAANSPTSSATGPITRPCSTRWLRRISSSWACQSNAGPDGKWGMAGLQSLTARSPNAPTRSRTEAEALNITDAGRKAKLGAKTRREEAQGATAAGATTRRRGCAQLTDAERDALARVYRRAWSPAARGSDGQRKRWRSPSPIAAKSSAFPERELKRVALLLRAGPRHAGADRGRAAAPGRHHRR